MGFNIVAEAILRLEHKIDALMKHFKIITQPMHFIGNTCPVCNKPIDYQIDTMKSVVVRKCDCKTGKIPSSIPLETIIGGNNAGTRSNTGGLTDAEVSYWGEGGSSSSGDIRKRK